MSNLKNNTTQLEALLVKVNALSEANSSEDITEETETYTEKLAVLENAVMTLENELEGKVGTGLGPKLVKVYHRHLSSAIAYYINADYEIVTLQRDTEADVLGGIILYWGTLNLEATGDYTTYKTGTGCIIKFNADNGQFAFYNNGGSDD